MKINYNGIELDVLPPVKRYMNGIERRLNADRATKVRIMTELAGDFAARREAGQSDDDIMADMGTPEAIAAEFNASLGTRPASRWRWAFAAIAAAAVLPLPYLPLLSWVSGLLAPSGDSGIYADSVGVIGGADGPTAVWVTTGGTAAILSVLPYLLACLAGFLLLGWCRRGDPRRYGLPILLCLAGIVPFGVYAIAEAVTVFRFWTGYELRYALRALLGNYFLGSGVWLCLVVLVLAVAELLHARKRQKPSNE